MSLRWPSCSFLTKTAHFLTVRERLSISAILARSVSGSTIPSRSARERGVSLAAALFRCGPRANGVSGGLGGAAYMLIRLSRMSI